MRAASAVLGIATALNAIPAHGAGPQPEDSHHVVLTHGIDSKGHDLRPLQRRLLREGFTVHAFVYAPSDGRKPLDAAAADLAEFVRSRVPFGKRFTLIAFSMGGLVARWYLDMLGGTEHAQRLITIASPHRGSLLAWLRFTPGARQLRPGSDFLRALSARNGPVQSGQFETHSFWTPLDLMVVPPWSSRVPWASSNRAVLVLAHPLMLRDGRVHNAVIEILSQ